MKKFRGFVRESQQYLNRAMMKAPYGSSIRADADRMMGHLRTLGHVRQSIENHLRATDRVAPPIDPTKPKSAEWHKNYEATMGQPYLPNRPPRDADGKSHILSPVTTHVFHNADGIKIPLSAPISRKEVKAQYDRAGEAMKKLHSRLLSYPHIDHEIIARDASGGHPRYDPIYVKHGTSKHLLTVIDRHNERHPDGLHPKVQNRLRVMSSQGTTLNLNHGKHGSAVTNMVLGRDPEVIHHAGDTPSETNENVASDVSSVNLSRDTIIESFFPVIKETNDKRRSELNNHIVNYLLEKKDPRHVEGHAKGHSKPATGSKAEAQFVTGMGGRASTAKAGAQTPDLIFSHSEHGTHEGEMKSGGTIDLAQQRFAVHRETGRLQHTTKGKITGRLEKLVKGVTKRMEKLPAGKIKTLVTSKKTGEKKTKYRAKAADELPKERRLKLNWKNTHALMSDKEAIHVHVHPKTGHTVIVPNKRKHHHLGKKLGLNKTVSFHSLSKSHGSKRSGFTLRGFRPKGSSINASFEGSSAHLVNAVRDAGGYVFDSIDHATAHLKKHGWSAKSGHKR